MEAQQMQLLVSEKEAHLRANNQASFTARQRTEALAASCPQLSLFQEHWSRCFRAAPAMTLELTAFPQYVWARLTGH